MIDSMLPGILAVFLCFVSGALAQVNGGSYECRPKAWTEGETATVEFRIDRSEFQSKCATTSSGKPSFVSSPNGITGYTPMCTVDDSIQTSCSITSGTMGCGCINDNDNGFYVIEYNFVVAADIDRWWKANIECLTPPPDLQQALTFTNIDCADVPVVTTPSPTTVTTPSPTTECGTNCIIIIVVVIVVVVVLVIILLYKKCGGGGR